EGLMVLPRLSGAIAGTSEECHHQAPKHVEAPCHSPYHPAMSVVVTGNEIYMVGRQITSLMVAQDARNETRGLDRFGPSGGGNTLRPVCGCIIPVLGCALGLLEAIVV